MMIDSVAALRILVRARREHREREKIDSIIRYSRNKTKPNLGKILGSVDLEHGSEAFIARGLIAGCRTRIRCGLYGCPSCGRRFKAKAKLEVLKTIVCRCGRLPDRDEVSWVTINGPRVRLEDYLGVEVASAEFRKKLTKLRAKHAKGTSWIGYFDITLKGVIHWHGIVLHPALPRMKLISVLRGELAGRRVVRVMELDQTRSLIDNLESVVDYSLVADRHAKVEFRKSRAGAGVPELVPCEGLRTAELVAHRIVALQYMAQRGLQGIRLCLNMRSPRVWKAGVMFDKSTGEVIVVPEIEKMILEKRKEAKKRRRDQGWNRNWRKKGMLGKLSSRLPGENLGVRPYATGLLRPSHAEQPQTPNEIEGMAAGTEKTEAGRGTLEGEAAFRRDRHGYNIDVAPTASDVNGNRSGSGRYGKAGPSPARAIKIGIGQVLNPAGTDIDGVTGLGRGRGAQRHARFEPGSTNGTHSPEPPESIGRR